MHIIGCLFSFLVINALFCGIEPTRARLKYYEPSLGASLLPNEFSALFVPDLKVITAGDLFRNASDLSDNKCNGDIQTILNNFKTHQPWAKLMMDSLPKKPSKLLKFNRFNFGNMEECLEINPPENFTTKYCSVFINDTLYPYIAPRFGLRRMRTPFYYTSICVPSTCSIEYMNKFFGQILIPKTNQTFSDYVEIKIEQDDCLTRNDPHEFSAMNYATMTFFGCLLALVLISTGIDVFKGKARSPFSLMLSGPLLFKSYQRKLTGSVPTVLGLKAMCALYIVTSHVAYVQQNGLVDSFYLEELFGLGRQVEGKVFILNAYSSVDIFLAISGMLMVFSFYGEISKRTSYDPVVSIIKRYFRLNLTIWIIYLFYSGLVDKLGNGPMFKPLCRYYQSYCTTNDFFSLIFGVYNFRTMLYTCFPHVWYVALDLQLFAFSQLVLIVALWSPRRAFLLTLLLTLGGIATDFSVAYINKMGIIMNYDASKMMSDREYTLPHTRCVPWFLGMAMGFFLKREPNISKTYRVIGWIFYVGNLWASIMPLMYFSKEYDHPLISALYLCYRRLGWTFMAAWPIITSHLGHFSIPSFVLSWKPLIFIGTISYELYLVHYILIEYRIALGTETFFLSYERIAYHFFPTIVYGTALSSAIFLLITVPFNFITVAIVHKLRILNIAARNIK